MPKTKQPAKKTPTPQELLLARKALLRQQCLGQEQKLDEDFACFRDNAGRLLLSGASWLISSGSKTGKKANALPVSASKAVTAQPASPVFNWTDILSLGKALWPVAWEIASPILFSWGINRIAGALFKSKKRPKG
jgi:hypothetical protein